MITGSQARMARAALKLGVRDVAAAAKVSPATVTRVEADQAANSSTLAVIRSTLEAAGIEFIDGDVPGVRLRNTTYDAADIRAHLGPPGSGRPVREDVVKLFDRILRDPLGGGLPQELIREMAATMPYAPEPGWPSLQS